MRVLITGIDGFVGSHAAEMLVGQPDIELHGTVIDGGLRNIAHLADRIHLHTADITDASVVQKVFEEARPDRVLHIAGQAFVPLSLQAPGETFDTNISGGINILESARKLTQEGSTTPAVLIVSSGEVYGRVEPSDLPVTESHPLRPHNPYAASKASIDLIAQQYASCLDVNAIVVRPFNHIGPGQNPTFVVSDFAKQCAEIALGMRHPAMHVGNIDVKRDFTDVRDVVRAYWLLFEREGMETVFNVASGRSMEIRRILEMLRELSGFEIEVVQERARFRAYDVVEVVASYERLNKATGWTPKIPFEQTLRDVYSYWHTTLKDRPSDNRSAH